MSGMAVRGYVSSYSLGNPPKSVPFSVNTPTGVPPELLPESLLLDEPELSDALELSEDAGALGWLVSGVPLEELLSELPLSEELPELWDELDEPEL